MTEQTFSLSVTMRGATRDDVCLKTAQMIDALIAVVDLPEAEFSLKQYAPHPVESEAA
jgi:hypothetical protein